MNKLTWKLALLFFWFYIRCQKINNYLIPLYGKKQKNKVFGIGDIKTGTQSLHKALKILGYRSSMFIYRDVYVEKGEDAFVQKVKKCNYDAFVDFPFGEDVLFKKIDKAIPNSKFILTLREPEAFVKSYENYFKTSPFEGYKKTDLDKRRKKFEKHNKEVIEYFKDKPDKLLKIRITEGEGWEKLCDFLDKPVPKKPFPHRNKGKYKKK